MQKVVTVRGLNEAYLKEIIHDRVFWFTLSVYILGVIVATLELIFGGIIMFVGALLMIGTDYQCRQRVVKKLRWVK